MRLAPKNRHTVRRIKPKKPFAHKLGPKPGPFGEERRKFQRGEVIMPGSREYRGFARGKPLIDMQSLPDFRGLKEPKPTNTLEYPKKIVGTDRMRWRTQFPDRRKKAKE